MTDQTVSTDVARELLDFARRIGDAHRAEEQLRGAVAIHNILQKHRVAYLADEVGMGKTYVALGALALFRHFQPDFRVLVISPRENIQNKWQKELTNFSRHNIRLDDLRMRSLDGRPPRALVSCDNLTHFVQEATLDPGRDFFARMSSFSLAMGNDNAGGKWQRIRDGLREHLPWLPSEVFDLRSKETFKRNYARALCCALPAFDLVIVDEAHNLKHGRHSSAMRNQLLAEAFGQTDADAPVDRTVFSNYGARARRVLFLSATPLEETYRHVWNQLDIFGLGDNFEELKDERLPDDRKKQIASQFLIRRVSSIKVNGNPHTKNMYRREWRSGGVATHDEPITIRDERQRLVIALIQKKVSEILRDKRFNHTFQIGMLSSFESFLETTKLKREEHDIPVFDDSEQSTEQVERDGIDVADLNRLARDYRKRFGTELPHPKMDAVADELGSSFQTGRKALIFVRRVASVKELKQRLDAKYDAWLISLLRNRLPPGLVTELNSVVRIYESEKATRKVRVLENNTDQVDEDIGHESRDSGGIETFFAWFFRGEGPKGIVSGANIQGRFVKSSGQLATFFSDNHVMWLLAAEPGSVLDMLAAKIKRTRADTEALVRDRAVKFLGRDANITRSSRTYAAQGAALELLSEMNGDGLGNVARIVLQERYPPSTSRPATAPLEIASSLERPTFFSEIRRAKYAALAQRIWPGIAHPDDLTSFRSSFREQSLRGEFLSAAARLGHAFIDMYCIVMSTRKSLAIHAQIDPANPDDDLSTGDADLRQIEAYLDWLEWQRTTVEARPWGAYDELSEISENFELILDVNAPELHDKAPDEAARAVSNLLRQQQPIGGMSGQVNKTLIGQFRMPGYPFVLVSTDLLQEGEDLHTFCSSVIHYGISWTPSSMEQRTGRIDRVRSHSDRRLSRLEQDGVGEDWLQVFFPHLADTVEVLQVDRVLERMDTFIGLMHEGFSAPVAEQRTINVSSDIIGPRRKSTQSKELLQSAFPIPDWALKGSLKEAATSCIGADLKRRFLAIRDLSLPGLHVTWEANAGEGSILGTVTLQSSRVQPFTLLLHADGGHPVVRCISPIWRTNPDVSSSEISEQAAILGLRSKIGAILTREDRSYDLTVEDSVWLVDEKHDDERIALLVMRVTSDADNLERRYLGRDHDGRMHTFERDLRKESTP